MLTDYINYTTEEIKSLKERFPFLIPRSVWNNQYIEDSIFLDNLPKGWHKLFLQMCEDIREPLIKHNFLNEMRIIQLKEKYGEIRCYVNGVPKEVETIIENYSFISSQVCCHCGKPATKLSRGWICPYCNECLKDTENVDYFEFNPIRMYTYFKKGQSRESRIDCTDIWNRYISSI